MKLFLTSTGLANEKLRKEFTALLTKPFPDIKVIFVPTAARTKEELKYVDESKQELLDLGISENNIKILTLDDKVAYTDVKDYDIIYVCGGNTFYLLKKVKESGFDKVIKEFVLDPNKIYFGVSAGTIIVSQDIEIAGLGEFGDPNDVNLKDISSLNLTNYVFAVHYSDAEKEFVDNYEKQTKHKIIRITNEQALVVIDKNKKVVG